VDIMRKANASKKNASAASTFMFVRVRKNPIKISSSPVTFMTKIQNLEEFKQIRDTKFGFIVAFDGTANVLHQNTCNNLTDDKFSNQETSHHWFSSLALAEKAFTVTICNACKPE